ncbi:MAG: xanthine dehydrogenase family protein molybdopterin-binding subunit [Alphaproteobacteria bacterium]
MTRYAISQPVNAVESPRLLKGRGRYTDDVQLPRLAHAVFLRSPHAHAVIKSTDTRAAQQMPGVVAVLTGEDWASDKLGNVPGNAPPKRKGGEPGYRPARPGLTRDKVRHVGQMIAMVIADSVNEAKDAMDRIEIDYEVLDPVTDAVAANQEGAPLVWPDCPDNEAFFSAKGKADATEEALKKAPHVLRERFYVTRVAASTMEPRSAVAEYDEGRDHYTVYACQQRPFVWRNMMTKGVFRIPENNMTVIAGDVGGSFGMKGGLYPEVPVVAWAARRVGRPVKWTCERSEAYIADDQGRDVVIDAEVGYDQSGKIHAVKFRGYANIGAYLSMTGFGAPNGVPGCTCNTYDIPVAFGDSRAIFTNTVPMANYRGPSGTPGVYVLERVLDMIAREIGMDPTELRRRNYVPASAMPYQSANGQKIDSGDFEGVMDQCLKLADYAGVAKRKEEAKARGKLYGVGVSSSIDPSGSPAPETAELRFDPTGSVTVLTASTAGGQQHATIYTQIVSDILGLDAEKIGVVEGDTSKLSWGSGTGAARTATLCGTVVFQAAEKTREKGRRIAAHMMETTPEDVTFEDGTYFAKGTNRSVTFDEVVKTAFSPNKLPKDMEFGMFETAAWTSTAANIPNTFHVVEVEVDPETGTSEMKRYSVVYDVGVELNPMGVAGQMRGGVVQAAAQALREQIVIDPESGQVLTGSFMDYAMPRAKSVCDIALGSHPTPTKQNPLGVKGAGEGGTVGALAAVMNAVNDALAPVGVRNLMMPATPERVWRAIQDAKVAKAG